MERAGGFVGRCARPGAHRQRRRGWRLDVRGRPAARLGLARQQQGGDRPPDDEQGLVRGQREPVYARGERVRRQLALARIHQRPAVHGGRPPGGDETDGGNEGFGTVRGSMTRQAWGGTLTSSLYAHGGTWHIFLTIPPEGGIGEGVQSQTE